MSERQSAPIPEDMDFQYRNWRAERIGWTVMTVAVVAGLLGVFARGIVSDGRIASNGATFTVEYERFAHKTARTYFTVRIRGSSTPEVRLRLNRAFVETYDIEVLQPQPLRATASAAGVELVMARSGENDVAVDIAARPRRFGRASLAVEVEGQGSASFTQFIYP
jgi:hypothetical protein